MILYILLCVKMRYVHYRNTHIHINLLRFNKVYLYILTDTLQAIARISEHKLLSGYQIDCKNECCKTRKAQALSRR